MPNEWAALPFTQEEYSEWEARLEAGYGQLRPEVCPDQVLKERISIPKAIRHTYLVERYLGKQR